MYSFPANANKPYFYRANNETATTVLNYMTPGNGTTTLTLPNTEASGMDYATVVVQVTATSTGVAGAVNLNLRVEGSHDGTDWYAMTNQVPFVAGGSSSTTILTTNPYANYLLTMSTSTTPANNFGGSGTATKMYTSVVIPTHLRYTRVIFTDPASGGNYGVWADVIGRKQAN